MKTISKILFGGSKFLINKKKVSLVSLMVAGEQNE